MNIDTSGLISLFSGENGLDNLAAAGGPGGLSTEQFAAALSAQIAALSETRGMQQTAGETDAESGLISEFAALHGKNLPRPGLDKGDIDLNATLNALTEVLKNIDAAQVAGLSSSIDPVSAQMQTEADKAGGLLIDPVMEENTDLSVADGADSIPVTAMPAPLPWSADQQSFNDALGAPGGDAGKMTTTQPAITALHADQPMSQKVMSSAPEQAEAEVVKSGGQGLENFAGKGADTSANSENFNQSSTASANAALFDGIQGDVEKADPESLKTTLDIGAMNRALSNTSKSELPAMTLPLSHREWGNELAEKMVWMHKQSVPSAELNLNPRHLGPITIRVDVNQEQTSIAFTTHNSVVKEAIETSLPRLRELLGTQQLNLVDVNVSQQQSEQKQAGGFFQASSGQGRQHSEVDGESQTEPVVSVAEEIEAGRALVSQGILSLFA